MRHLIIVAPPSILRTLSECQLLLDGHEMVTDKKAVAMNDNAHLLIDKTLKLRICQRGVGGGGFPRA